MNLKFHAISAAAVFALSLHASTSTVTFTVADTTMTNAVSDFETLVRLSTSIENFSYSDFAKGSLVFRDSDGNAIPHEVESWNTSGESLVWVRLPTMQTGTSFTMETGTETASTVMWSGYAGVWHLDDLSDSGPSSLDATQSTSGVETGVSGVLGSCVSLTSTSGYLEMSGDFNSAFSCSSNINVSFWFKPAVAGTSSGRLVGNKTNSISDNGFEAILVSAKNIYLRGDGASRQLTYTPTFDDDMHLYSFRYENGTAAIYIDGAWVASKANVVPGPSAVTTALRLGRSASGGCPGLYDELRVHDGCFKSDRVKADYATVANASFLTAVCSSGGGSGTVVPATTAYEGKLYVYEPFGESYANASSFNGVSNVTDSVGFSLEKPWLSTTAVYFSGNFSDDPTSLSYPSGSSLSALGRTAYVKNGDTSSTQVREQSREFESALPTSGTLYVSFLFRVQSGAYAKWPTGYNSMYGLDTKARTTVSGGAPASVPDTGVFMGVRKTDSAADLVVSAAGSCATLVSGIAVDTTYLCTARIDMNVDADGRDVIHARALPVDSYSATEAYQARIDADVVSPASPFAYIAMYGTYRLSSKYIWMDEYRVADTIELSEGGTSCTPSIIFK